MNTSILLRNTSLRITNCLIILLLTGVSAGCASNTPRPEALAEQFITTFYSWDAAALAQLMLPSAEADNALYYQAWAQAANYAVKTRRPCVRGESGGLGAECRITVTDDFGRALGYTATDTFKLTFDGNKLSSVTFTGDDPPVFEEVFAWLSTDRPELFTGVCKDLFAGGTQPAACARAVATGARDWAEAHPRASR